MAKQTKKSVVKKGGEKRKTTSASSSGSAKKDTKKKISGKTLKTEELNLRIYPIGKLKQPEDYTETVINKLIQDIRILPGHLKTVSKKLNKKKKLEYAYRDGGWNVAQLIHHIADSHLNAFIRFKLALTENNPVIKPYDENLWSETADMELPVKTSIRLIKALHAKWTALLENMDRNDLKRTYFHPEHNRRVSLQEALAMYAWHGKHHVAQIEVALKHG
ncbi:MAG: yfiT [Bacteroidota bacterium]|nr:yfiT [Bacteroidota bacterium]